MTFEDESEYSDPKPRFTAPSEFPESPLSGEIERHIAELRRMVDEAEEAKLEQMLRRNGLERQDLLGPEPRYMIRMVREAESVFQGTSGLEGEGPTDEFRWRIRPAIYELVMLVPIDGTSA